MCIHARQYELMHRPPPHGSSPDEASGQVQDQDKKGSNGSAVEPGEPEAPRWRRARRRPGSRPGLY